MSPLPHSPPTALTQQQVYRIIAPKRRWRRWLLAFALVWGGLGVCCMMRFAGQADPAWVTWPILIGLLMVPVATVFLPATLGPIHLWDDVRAGRLESLILTGADGLATLRAYRRRTFLTAVLLLALFAPTWAFFGRAPLPLLLVKNVAECNLDSPGLLTAPRFVSGLLTDLTTAWLAAALGMAALVFLRSRGWAMVLGTGGTLGVGALGCLGGVGLAKALYAWGLKWYEPAWLFGAPVEPGYLVLLWSFALPFAAGSFLIGEIALRMAARRFDRLVSD